MILQFSRDITVKAKDEKGNDQDIQLVDIEKSILCTLLNVAGRYQKMPADFFRCGKRAAEIEDFKNPTEIELTEKELELIKMGFEQTAGNRFPDWSNPILLPFWEQLFK